jgi:hypothetical protein
VDARTVGCGCVVRLADCETWGAFSLGHRREPRPADRFQGARSLPQAAGRDARLPRRNRCDRAPGTRRQPGARGTRSEDAGTLRGPVPYLVTPDHTRYAREHLGDGPLLLPEQTVLLTDDKAEARAVGTDWLRAYLALPNYANNLLRSGFTQDDIDSVSDRLFDALIAWGDEDTVLRRVNEHRQAGADHVCVQVLTADPREFPREQWRRLGAALS